MVWAGAHRKSATDLVKYCLLWFFTQALFSCGPLQINWSWICIIINPNSYLAANINALNLIGHQKWAQYWSCSKCTTKQHAFVFRCLKARHEPGVSLCWMNCMQGAHWVTAFVAAAFKLLLAQCICFMAHNFAMIHVLLLSLMPFSATAGSSEKKTSKTNCSAPNDRQTKWT